MKYLTPSQYAKTCGVSRQAIYDRLTAGTLHTVEKQDFTGKTVQVIDLKKYPPMKGRRKKNLTTYK